MNTSKLIDHLRASQSSGVARMSKVCTLFTPVGVRKSTSYVRLLTNFNINKELFVIHHALPLI